MLWRGFCVPGKRGKPCAERSGGKAFPRSGFHSVQPREHGFYDRPRRPTGAAQYPGGLATAMGSISTTWWGSTGRLAADGKSGRERTSFHLKSKKPWHGGLTGAVCFPRLFTCLVPGSIRYSQPGLVKSGCQVWRNTSSIWRNYDISRQSAIFLIRAF